MRHFNSIVIGAGNAGLCAAAALQRGGSSTLLLERHNIPGGCATSFVRGEFEFEVALHQLSGLGTEDKPSIMRQVFGRLGVMDRVEFVEEHALYRMVVPGEFDIALPADWAQLKQTLQDAFPTESDAIQRFLDLCEMIAFEANVALHDGLKSNNEDFFRARCPHFVKYGFKSVKEVLDEYFQNPKLKSVLAVYWTYAGVPPSKMRFCDLASMLYAYAEFKPWHIKGGSQAMSTALMESFHEAGGEVHFNCGAEKIITKGGRVSGVRLETGEVVSCDAVVSNASPIATFHDLLDFDQPPLNIQEDFKSRRMGTSAFAIYLGLNCTPQALGITQASTFVQNTLNEDLIHGSMESMDAVHSALLTCYNLEDSDFAPLGKSNVTLLCLQYGDKWKDVPPEQYAQAKYECAEKLIVLMEQVFPGIRDHIEEVEVATPLTMMRYLNTPDGAIYGFQQSAQDSQLLRQRLDGVPGLYHAGAWTGVGGFQPTYMAGESTARAVLKQINTKEVKYA